MSTSHGDFFKSKVLGHPSGLFTLFFTEMWERFSYYGMRSLLVMFLTAALMDDGSGGWGWPREHALALFGSYTALVYLSTMIGGWFADNKIGYRWAVVIGALLMTLGHASMAIETHFSIYAGLTLLVFGSGFFKPNMTSIISEMYKDHTDKKDGAYTIFYMGVNAGAFLGILLCGYLGEKIGWSLGFGLAGIFMLFGLLQFWMAQGIFGDVGKVPENQTKVETVTSQVVNDEEKRNPFTTWQYVVIVICSALGLGYILNGPASLISNNSFNIFNFNVGGLSGNNFAVIVAVGLFIFLLIYRLTQYSKVTKEKLVAVTFFAFLTMFFWAIFEQAPGSLTIFARDYTDRVLEGSAGMTFKIVNSLMTIIPLGIISWVLFLYFKQTFKKYAGSNIFLGISFLVIWGIALWMLSNEFQDDKTEIPASWFGVLNSLFIITFAPLFSKWWESKYNPSANIKYGIGLTLLAIGMACVAIGSSGIEAGAATASVSIIWLILVYFFHTLGELCISPLGLSYVSKLVPARMIAFMFGIWYIAIAIGMKTAGELGANIDKIANEHGLSTFFWILTIIPLILAALSIVLSSVIKKLMHGVR